MFLSFANFKVATISAIVAGIIKASAGPPILNVLEKNKLTNILCIVVRYYGGIKLGAGGLIRAYGKSVREALLQATLKDVIDGYVVTFELDYDLITTINSLINNYKVLSKVFEEKIKYSIFLDTLDDEVLRSLNELNIKYEVEKKCL